MLDLDEHWTLEYIVTEGVPGEEKTFDDWGLTNPVITYRSTAGDECTFSHDSALFDGDSLFAYEKRCVVRSGRHYDGSSWSDGVTRFTGLVMEPQRDGSGESERMTYTLAGAWYWLENLPYEQFSRIYAGPHPTVCNLVDGHTCPEGYVTDGTNDFLLQLMTDVVLNFDTEVVVGFPFIGTRAQIAKILQFAIDNGAMFQFVEGDIPDVEVPTKLFPEVPCARAIIEELAWLPDCEAWFDYSTEPPTFKCVRRADLAKLTLQVRDPGLPNTQPLDSGSDAFVDAVSVRERKDIARSQVKINYRRSNTVDGLSWVDNVVDLYPNPENPSHPPLSDNSPFHKVKMTIDLIGVEITNQTAEVVTEVIQPDSADWWKARHKWIENVDNFSVTPTSGTPPYANELVSGTVVEWMTVSGSPVVEEEHVVRANATYRKKNGSYVKDEKISYALRATNATTGTYSTQTSSGVAEPVPVDLAKRFWEALNERQYQGRFSLVDVESSELVSIGVKMCVVGGRTEWETMDAAVREVTLDVENGVASGSFGPNRYLNPSELVDLTRVTRTRRTTPLVSQKLSGRSGGSVNVANPKATPEKNSAAGALRYEKLVVSENETPASAPDAEKGQFYADAKDRSMWLGGSAVEGTVEVRLTPSAATTGSGGKEIKIREMPFCYRDDDGTLKAGKIRILCSLPYT